MRKRQTKAGAGYVRLTPISFDKRIKNLSKLIADITALRRQMRDAKDKEIIKHFDMQIAELEKHRKRIGKPIVRERETLWTEMANVDKLIWTLRTEAKHTSEFQGKKPNDGYALELKTLNYGDEIKRL